MSVTKDAKHLRFADALAAGATIREAKVSAKLRLRGCQRLSRYYVYMLVDPRDDKPFYVGKGKGRRAYQHVADYRCLNVTNADKHMRIADIHRAGHKVQHICVAHRLSEDDAYDLERVYIRTIGLKNLTNGAKGIRSNRVKTLVWAKSHLKRVRPFCRWKLRILPQLMSEPDKSMSAVDHEHLYWDWIGKHSELLAQVERRPYKNHARMWQPNAHRP